jgi:ribosomal protein L31
LDSSNAITVEMWQMDEDEPKMSFLIGNDAGQGTSFVRISGDKSVYRANVGGRRRFAHSASDWLNQRVFQLQMSELASVEVDSESHPMYTLQNGEDWTVVGATDPVDVSRLVKALQDVLLVRIGSIVTEGQSIDSPWLQLLLKTKDARQIPVLVGKPEGRQTLVEVNGQRYQVPVLPFEHFTTGESYFMDKRVFPIRSREELDLIRYTTAVTDIVIQQDLSNGFWKVLQPSNVDLEMRDAFFMVNTLSTLSSILEVPTSVVEGQEPKLTLEIRRLQGDVFRLKVFDIYDQEGVQGYLCQVDGLDGAFVAIKDDIERIINGFGQANVF